MRRSPRRSRWTQRAADSTLTAPISLKRCTADLEGSAAFRRPTVAVGLVAIGDSVAKADANGSISSHVDGTVLAGAITIPANATHTANAKADGRRWRHRRGRRPEADATVTPTFAPRMRTARSPRAARLRSPRPRPPQRGVQRTRDRGVRVGLGGRLGRDRSTASPTITAYAGGSGVTLTAASALSVGAAMFCSTGAETAHAESTGATGGLLLGANATLATATNNAIVTSYVADGTTLVVNDAVSINATGNSKQTANANSLNIGLIAVGANISTANTGVQTKAYLGQDVTISNGTDIGGLTDGGTYYVVLATTSVRSRRTRSTPCTIRFQPGRRQRRPPDGRQGHVQRRPDRKPRRRCMPSRRSLSGKSSCARLTRSPARSADTSTWRRSRGHALT